LFTALARNGGAALDRCHDRQRGQRQGALDRITIPQVVLERIAPTALPRSSDHRLGRAPKPRDQLSHRVRRSSEQPAQGGL